MGHDVVQTTWPGDGVALLTLADPATRNAMTVDMGTRLQSTVAELSAEPGLRAVVVTGEPPAFSAGGDLDMLEDYARRTRDEGFDATGQMESFYRLFLSVRELPVPVVAAVNGHAIGAGLCFALACDLMVVADKARLGMTFSRLGLHPGMGGSWLLPERVGAQRAAELLYTGRLLDGVEAASIGLALEALPTSKVLPAALALAGQIAAASPVVVRQLRRTLSAPRGSLSEHLRVEAANQSENYATDDLREGLAAAREKRDPRFSPNGAPGAS